MLAEAAVRESEMRFRSVAESANDAIVAADDEGRLVFWNHAASIIFGYQESEVLGKPMTNLMPERYREAHQSGLSGSTRRPKAVSSDDRSRCMASVKMVRSFRSNSPWPPGKPRRYVLQRHHSRYQPSAKARKPRFVR